MKTPRLLLVLLLSLAGKLCAGTPGQLTFALTGDIMMGTTYPAVQLPPQDGSFLFDHVAPLLRRADFAAGNLEGTLCAGMAATKEISAVKYAFCTPPAYVAHLKSAGYDFLSIANNHIYDFGEEGVRSTVAALRDAGIAFAGLRGRFESALVERGGATVAFCAFGHNHYTCRHADLMAVRRIITDLCNRADVVVVSFHGGAEGRASSRLPYGKEIFYGEDRGSLREFARFCVDAGADVVYGHGPHVCRAVELYKEHLIAYSLGNFCTPFGISLGGVSGYAPLLEVRTTRDGRFAGGRIHSFVQRRGTGPRADSTYAAAREIRRLTQLDMPDTPIEVRPDGTLVRR